METLLFRMFPARTFVAFFVWQPFHRPSGQKKNARREMVQSKVSVDEAALEETNTQSTDRNDEAGITAFASSNCMSLVFDISICGLYWRKESRCMHMRWEWGIFHLCPFSHSLHIEFPLHISLITYSVVPSAHSL